MMTTADIASMSKMEKLQVMEAIWEDLSRNESEVAAPTWHKNALKQTEQRVSEGLEQPVDWKDAKEQLRNRF